MRIIGGDLKGRKINLSKKFSSRPTTDFAREALFSYLESKYSLNECHLLDLFGGSGAISFEFLSRRGAKATCLELDVFNLKGIHQNAEALGLGDRFKLHRQDAFRWVKKELDSFDIIFADPPFTRTEKYQGLIESVLNGALLKPGGLFVLEHPSDYELSSDIGSAELRIFGNQSFYLFTKS